MQGDFRGASEMFTRVLEVARRQGCESEELVRAMNNLAFALDKEVTPPF